MAPASPSSNVDEVRQGEPPHATPTSLTFPELSVTASDSPSRSPSLSTCSLFSTSWGSPSETRNGSPSVCAPSSPTQVASPIKSLPALANDHSMPSSSPPRPEGQGEEDTAESEEGQGVEGGGPRPDSRSFPDQKTIDGDDPPPRSGLYPTEVDYDDDHPPDVNDNELEAGASLSPAASSAAISPSSLRNMTPLVPLAGRGLIPNGVAERVSILSPFLPLPPTRSHIRSPANPCSPAPPPLTPDRDSRPPRSRSRPRSRGAGERAWSRSPQRDHGASSQKLDHADEATQTPNRQAGQVYPQVSPDDVELMLRPLMLEDDDPVGAMAGGQHHGGDDEASDGGFGLESQILSKQRSDDIEAALAGASPSRIRDVVLNMDLSALAELDLEALACTAPTSLETIQVKKHAEQQPAATRSSTPATDYILTMADIPQIKLRFQALRFQRRFPEVIDKLTRDVDVFMCASRELMNSSALRRVISIANRTARQTKPGSDNGSFSSLAVACLSPSILTDVLNQLHDSRAFGAPVSALHPDLFTDVERANQLAWADVSAELKRVRFGAAIIGKQLAVAQPFIQSQAGPVPDKFKAAMAGFHSTAEELLLAVASDAEMVEACVLQIMEQYGEVGGLDPDTFRKLGRFIAAFKSAEGSHLAEARAKQRTNHLSHNRAPDPNNMAARQSHNRAPDPANNMTSRHSQIPSRSNHPQMQSGNPHQREHQPDARQYRHNNSSYKDHRLVQHPNRREANPAPKSAPAMVLDYSASEIECNAQMGQPRRKKGQNDVDDWLPQFPVSSISSPSRSPARGHRDSSRTNNNARLASSREDREDLETPKQDKKRYRFEPLYALNTNDDDSDWDARSASTCMSNSRLSDMGRSPSGART